MRTSTRGSKILQQANDEYLVLHSSFNMQVLQPRDSSCNDRQGDTSASTSLRKGDKYTVVAVVLAQGLANRSSNACLSGFASYEYTGSHTAKTHRSAMDPLVIRTLRFSRSSSPSVIGGANWMERVCCSRHSAS